MKRFILLLAGLALSPIIYAAPPPNVVVFLADDQGWGDLRYNGNTDLKTPHVDSLAHDGARFENFYVCSVCSPTRAEFLTGRFHPRGGVFSTSAGGERLDLDETTIGDVFKAAGYKTAAYGKWHNGMQYPYHPNARGFEDFYGFCSGHWGHYFDWMLERNGRAVKGNGFCVDDFTDKALEFIDANKDNPFFVYLPYNTPHSPMQVPDEYWNRFKDKDLARLHPDSKASQLNRTRCALAMCENIDWNVGRVLKKLEDLKLNDNTIVVYFSDNGPNGIRWTDGLKGRKGSTDEGGVKVPLHIRYPAKIKPGSQIPQISSAADLLPTLAELAGIPCKIEKKLDGKSLIPLLSGSGQPWEERIIISHWRKRISARSQQYRLDTKGKLYDMIADKGQRKDVSKKFPKITAQLQAAIEDYKNNVLAELHQSKKRPFIIGHPAARFTQLPARDAEAKGAKRSNKFPNASYYTNWTTPSDSIYFKAEVVEAGTFKVAIFYTCPPEDIGSEVVLRGGVENLKFTLNQAHNPPLVGAAQDRTKRGESYVKDFRKMDIGTLRLNKGPVKLELKALHVPGKQVMDFRLMELERL